MGEVIPINSLVAEAATKHGHAKVGYVPKDFKLQLVEREQPELIIYPKDTGGRPLFSHEEDHEQFKALVEDHFDRETPETAKALEDFLASKAISEYKIDELHSHYEDMITGETIPEHDNIEDQDIGY